MSHRCSWEAETQSDMDPVAVRRAATQAGCREIAFNQKLRSQCFKVRNSSVQVNVFYEAGTVSLVMEHPRQGQIQVFRYDVDLNLVTEILTSPFEHIGSGYVKTPPTKNVPDDEEGAMRHHLEMLESEISHLLLEKEELLRRASAAGYTISTEGSGSVANGRPISRQASHSNKGPSRSTGFESDRSSPENEPALDNAMESLLRQQSDLNAQMERLLVSRKKAGKSSSAVRSRPMSRSASLVRSSSTAGAKGATRAAPSDSPGREGVGKDKDRKQPLFQAQKSVVNPLSSSYGGSHVTAAFRQRGNQCCYALCKPEYHKEFGAAWSLKPANVVALGRGYVILYDDGSVTWWDVPKLLDEKLKEQGSSTQAVRYLALGCDENYYVKFVDGKMEWCGPDSFGDVLRNGIQQSRLLVDKVAFGPNQGWLILWSDGEVQHERISPTLETLLREKHPDQHIKDISLGPNEEWFVIFKDNSVRAANLPDSLYRILSDVQDSGGRVRQVIFGENSSWYVRYWDGKS